ncbi:hypothetical protein FGLOB1_8146 [Fusarium globosum]|uniref:Uncharacterized protein n=1 Tax=Fusarium globosum TaxID=78864 RepID=A0A8H5Y5I0_9HYPO|nr:hypothetical protein FGLOB1_8146 [Fusarium globosum]
MPWRQTLKLLTVTYDDLDLDVSCTVQVSRAVASVEDDVLPIRGTYEIVLSLVPSAPIKLYRVTLRALQEEVPTESPDPWADAIINRGSDKGSSPMRSVSGASDRTTLLNSSWSQIWTTIHDNEPSGANLNISGSSDIKGRDDSYRLPHTQALTVSPIKIENRTNSEILDINFEIEDTEDGTGAFELRIEAILQIDNDGEGL